MTRVSVICDLLYTMAVREKHRFKNSKFGWKKRKAELISCLAAMQMLCQDMQQPEQTDEMIEDIVKNVPVMCPLLNKEPEFRGDFGKTMRERWEGAEKTADMSAELRRLLSLSGDIVSKLLTMLTGRHADEDETREKAWRYMQGLHNVIRPGLPPDDRFRVSPAQGWEFARSWLEPRFTFTPDPPAEEAAEKKEGSS